MARNTQANVEVKIFGNISDFSKKMNMAEFQAMGFQKKMLALSGVMKSWGRNMTLGVTIPVVAGMALAVKAASSLEETMNKVKVVFGQSSGEVIKFADTAARKLAMTKQEALDAASAFGNLFNTTGISSGDSADMSKTLVKLAADMASFNDSTPVEMLTKLRSGLVGEAEPLRTVGVLLSEARVQEEAYASGIAERGAVLTEAQKVQARYNIILKDTKKQQGDLDRTSDSLANQLKFLRAQAIELGASIGEVLIPMLKPLVGFFVKIAGVLSGLPGPIKYVIVGFGLMAAALGPLLWTLGAAAQGIHAIGEAWKMAKRLLRIGSWQAETTAIDLNTAALGRNNKARGMNSLAPGALGTGAGGLGAGSAGGGLIATAAGSAIAAVAVPVSVVAVVGGAAVFLTKSLNRQRGMDRRGIDPDTGEPVNVGTRRRGRGGTNDPSFRTLAESNLETRAAMRDQIASSHDNTEATKESTKSADELAASIDANTAVQKELWQMTAQEMADAASAATLTNDQLLAAAAAFGEVSSAKHDRTGQVGMKYRKFASGGSGITTGPMLALIGESGPEAYNIRPVNSGKGVGGTVHVHIGTLVGTDERAARQLSDMVGRHLMGGVLRGMVGQNA